MLGDDGEPPQARLDVTGVLLAEQQQEQSTPATSAEPFPLLFDSPGVVDAGDVSGVVARRKRSVTKDFLGGFLGVGKQQQQRQQQKQKRNLARGIQHLVGGGLGGGTQFCCRLRGRRRMAGRLGPA